MTALSAFSELLKNHQKSSDLISLNELITYLKEMFIEKNLNDEQEEKKLILACAYFVVLLMSIYNAGLPFSIAPSDFVDGLEKILTTNNVDDVEKILVSIVNSLMYRPIQDEKVVEQFHEVFSKVNWSEMSIFENKFFALKHAVNALQQEMLHPGNFQARFILLSVGGIFGTGSIALALIGFQLVSCALLMTGVGFLFAAVMIMTIATVMNVPKKSIRRTLDNKTYCFAQIPKPNKAVPSSSPNRVSSIPLQRNL